MSLSYRCVLGALLVGVATAPAGAQLPRVVSASFFDINDSSSGPLLSTSIAGAPPAQYSVPTDIRVSNWNNLPLQFLSVPGSNLDLVDSQGFATTVDVDWIGTDVLVNAWGGGILSGDSTMMNGAIQSTLQAPTDFVEIHVRDLANSFDLGIGYDVIIYADQDGVGGRQSFFVDDGIQVGSAITMLDVVDGMPAGRPFDAPLDYDEGTTDGAGSWIRFSGLTGPSFRIEALAVGSSPAFVNGFQIVGRQPVQPSDEIDVNGDRLIDGRDFVQLQRGIATGVYTGKHLVRWQSNYGAVIASPAAAIPEPTAAALIASTLAAVTLRRRR